MCVLSFVAWTGQRGVGGKASLDFTGSEWRWVLSWSSWKKHFLASLGRMRLTPLCFTHLTKGPILSVWWLDSLFEEHQLFSIRTPLEAAWGKLCSSNAWFFLLRWLGLIQEPWFVGRAWDWLWILWESLPSVAMGSLRVQQRDVQSPPGRSFAWFLKGV